MFPVEIKVGPFWFTYDESSRGMEISTLHETLAWAEFISIEEWEAFVKAVKK